MTLRQQLWLQAYQQVCLRRRNAPSNADIWDLRFHWDAVGKDLYNEVIKGRYRLSPMLVVGRGQERNPQWSAPDALVLKFVALSIQHQLPVSTLCGHVRGHGGIYRSLKNVATAFNKMRYVFRTDIRGFYENIRKEHVIAMIDDRITEPALANIFKQYVNYSVEEGGVIRTPKKGICRGCALSPLVGASLLWNMDRHFEKKLSDTFFYSRYMDDFLFMSHTRWPIRRSIKYLNTIFEEEGFDKHPDKTQVGKTSLGFDWLGVWFSTEGHTVSPRALENHQIRKQTMEKKLCLRGYHPQQIAERVRLYESRWNQWSRRLTENL